MLIRLKSLPKPGELDDYDLRRFQVGERYDLPPQLASILIVGGYAEPVSSGGALSVGASPEDLRSKR